MHSACYNIKAERQFYPEARQTGIIRAESMLSKMSGEKSGQRLVGLAGNESPVGEKDIGVTASCGV
ncbi:hypothetical protein DZA65_04098 [Dickeya dianthicola]|nr:hypothetical protein DZA65_04098 [Dickeya dianthicola]